MEREGTERGCRCLVFSMQGLVRRLMRYSANWRFPSEDNVRVLGALR
jgi:hypothetical protein